MDDFSIDPAKMAEMLRHKEGMLRIEMNTDYEKARATDPMLVLDDPVLAKSWPGYPHGGKMTEEQSKYERENPIITMDKDGKVTYLGPTPDQQIRMEALRCAVAHYTSGFAPDQSLRQITDDFEDYLKNGR